MHSTENDKTALGTKGLNGIRICTYFCFGAGGITLLCQLIMLIGGDRYNPLAIPAFLISFQSGLACIPASLALLGAAVYARTWTKGATAGLFISLAGLGIYIYWMHAVAYGRL